MASLMLDDATVWVGGHNFTCALNQVNINTSAAELDNTTFCSGGWRSRIGGLKDVQAQLAGYWDSAPDAAAFAGLGVMDQPVTVSPDAAEGSVAYLFRAGGFSYQAFGQIGEMTPFSLSMSGSDGREGVARGAVAAAAGEVSATGVAGSAVQLPAVAAGQHVYAALHVFAAGTTLTVEVESSPDDTFASPTTRGTLGPVTGAGGVWMARVAGPITDTYWRLNITAITGTFTIAGAIGIG